MNPRTDDARLRRIVLLSAARVRRGNGRRTLREPLTDAQLARRMDAVAAFRPLARRRVAGTPSRADVRRAETERRLQEQLERHYRHRHRVDAGIRLFGTWARAQELRAPFSLLDAEHMRLEIVRKLKELTK